MWESYFQTHLEDEILKVSLIDGDESLLYSIGSRVSMYGHRIKQLSLIREESGMLRVSPETLEMIAEILPHLEILELVNIDGIEIIANSPFNTLCATQKELIQDIVEHQAVHPELFSKLRTIKREPSKKPLCIRFEKLTWFRCENSRDLRELHMIAPCLKGVCLRDNPELSFMELDFSKRLQRLDIGILKDHLCNRSSRENLLRIMEESKIIEKVDSFGYRGLEDLVMKTFKIPPIRELEEEEGPKNISPLLRAVFSGRTELIEGLIEADFQSVNRMTPKRLVSPLMYAAQKGYLGISQILLKRGARVNDRNYFGATPLIFATEKENNKDVLELLLDNGAQINAQSNSGWSALHGAVVRKDPEMVGLLLSRGSDPDLKTDKGETPLIVGASCSGNFPDEQVLILMLSANSKINELTHTSKKKEDEEDYRYYDAWRFNPIISQKLMFFLTGRESVLMRSILKGQEDWIAPLLYAGADVNLTNDHGWTPLMMASSTPINVGILSLLLERGAYINAKENEGKTALSIALEGGCLEKAEFLLKKGAALDTNVCSKLGKACREKNEEESRRYYYKALEYDSENENALNGLGLSYCATGKGEEIEQGRRFLEKTLQINPRNIEALTLLMILYDHQKDYKKVRSLAHQIFEVNPFHYEALKCFGNMAFEENRLEEAYDYTIRALRALQLSKVQVFIIDGGLTICFPKERFNSIGMYHLPELRDLSLREIIFDMKMVRKSKRLQNFLRSDEVHSTLSIQEEKSSLLNQLGIIKYKEGDFSLALTHYQESYKQKPTPMTISNMGEVFEFEGNLEEADNYYRIALSEFPNVPHVLINIGRILQKKGNFEEAFDKYMEAWSQDSLSDWTYLHLGYLTSLQNEPGKEIEPVGEIPPIRWHQLWDFILHFQEMGSIPPSLERYLDFLRTNIPFQETLSSEILEKKLFFKREERLGPPKTELLKLLGDIWWDEEDVDKSLFYYEKAVQQNFTDVDVFGRLGHIMWNRGDLEKAEFYYHRVLSLDPQNSVAFNNFIALCVVQRDLGQAEFWADKALQKNPNDSLALNGLGLIHSKKGDMDRARFYYEKSLAIEPNAPNVLTNLGVLIQKNDICAAESVYRNASKIKYTRKSLENKMMEIPLLHLTFNLYLQNRQDEGISILKDRFKEENFKFSWYSIFKLRETVKEQNFPIDKKIELFSHLEELFPQQREVFSKIIVEDYGPRRRYIYI